MRKKCADKIRRLPGPGCVLPHLRDIFHRHPHGHANVTCLALIHPDCNLNHQGNKTQFHELPRIYPNNQRLKKTIFKNVEPRLHFKSKKTPIWLCRSLMEVRSRTWAYLILEEQQRSVNVKEEKTMQEEARKT